MKTLTKKKLQDFLDIAQSKGWRNPFLFWKDGRVEVGILSIAFGSSLDEATIESESRHFRINLQKPVNLARLTERLLEECGDAEFIELDCEGRVVTVRKLPVGAV